MKNYEIKYLARLSGTLNEEQVAELMLDIGNPNGLILKGIRKIGVHKKCLSVCKNPYCSNQISENRTFCKVCAYINKIGYQRGYIIGKNGWRNKYEKKAKIKI